MLITLTLLFYTSLFISLLVTGKSPKLAQWINAIDHPDERKSHQHAISRLGGIGIAIALFISLLLFVPLNIVLIAFLLGVIIIVITGLCDDILQISPIAKFTGQLVAVLFFVIIADVRLLNFGDLLGCGNISIGFLTLPITVLCMIGVINAINLSDGLDGLAGGLSAIATAFLAVLAYSDQNWLALFISVALFSAIIGFLRYNSYPAKLFMGDTGSLLLGYSLAAIAILLVQDTPAIANTTLIAPITIALVLALPIVDTVLVMLRRIWYGKSPFLPDKTHLHHRLIDIGFPHAAVVPLMYIIMVIMGTMALLLRNISDWLQLLLGISFMSIVFFSVSYCQHMQIIWRPIRRQKTSFHRNKIYYRMTVIVGKSMPWLLVFFTIILITPILFIRHLPSNMEYYLLAMAVLFAVLYPWRAKHGHYAIVHGLLYLSCIAIILLLNLNNNVVPWMASYLKIVSVLVLVWVLLKLLFKRHTEVFLTSGFELLMIFISWFIPIILLPQLHASELLINTLTLVCIESIPFFLAMKILIREQPRRNYGIAIAMLCALLLLSGKGFLVM